MKKDPKADRRKLDTFVFNEKYGRKGGVAKLTEFRALMVTQEEIAKHYKVSKERVSQWIEKFFGDRHDPRAPRRNAIVDCMIEFAKLNGEDEFNEAYKGHEYYPLAHERALREGIYAPK